MVQRHNRKEIHPSTFVADEQQLRSRFSGTFLGSILMMVGLGCQPVQAELQSKDIFSLSLLELGQVIISDTFTLTDTDYRDIPAAFTIIDRDMIDDSGARDLDELLEIYVPSLHSLHHPTRVGRRFVTRGIVSNDTVLMLVNGRVMNERLAGGAQSERGISTLGDIESIEVIRGPGAAVHGAGALAAVINIKTYSGISFEGQELSVRTGVLEEFVNMEYRVGKSYAQDNHLFFYYGIDSYEGGRISDSSYTNGSTFGGFSAGETSTFRVPPVNQSFRDKPRHKLHAQWNQGELEAWARYVKGGVNMATGPERGIEMTFGRAGYEQLTLMLNDSKQLNETLELKGKLSYDFFNAKEDRYSDAWESFWVDPDKGNITGPNPTAKGFLEQQYLAGIGLNWTPGQQHQLYLGYEFSFDKHAGKGFGWPHHDDATTEIKLRSAPWNTRMHSFIGEYQWQIGERFTLFTGARLDDHSKMDKRMFSPRAGLIFRQRDDRTFKLVYNKSVRRSDEASLQRFDEKDLEDIEYYDAIYEQQINDSLSSRLSAFYAQHNLINYSYTTTTTRPVGQTEFTGADWELTHHTSQWRNQLSLSYVKLLNLHLINPENRNSISAEPQGFGNDFAEVPNWTIKLHSSYQFDDKWRLNGSLISHLGVDGRRDMFEGLRAREVDPKIDDGVLLLNLGAAYQHSDQLTFNVNAHNVMGWLDKDLNNRFIRGLPDYRADVASLSFGLRYQFGD